MARADFRSNRPVIEIADVLRRHGDAYRHAHAGHLGRVERRVMSAITACRTGALGGHVEACDDCGMMRIAYNSCRNRHCPKCQGPARAAWLAAREAELLPVAEKAGENEDPWPLVDKMFSNPARTLPGDLAAGIGDTLCKKWQRLPAERKALLKLVSRFEIEPDQAKRAYVQEERADAGIGCTDADLLSNPYLLFEGTRLSADPISIWTVDRGVFPDEVVRTCTDQIARIFI